MTNKTKSKPATAGDLYTATLELKELGYKLRRKYYMQELRYKSIGASRKALKANQERRELIEELLKYITQYEALVCKRMDKEFKAGKNIYFTVYPNGRR